MNRSFPAALNFMLLAILALVPLPFAATRPLAEALLGIFAALLLALWAINWRAGASMALSPAKLRWPIMFVLLLAGWLFIQLMPLGAPYAHPTWGAAQQTLSLPVASNSISIDPGATKVGLMKLLSLVAIFAVTLQAARSHKFARQILATLAYSAIGYAIYGVYEYTTGNTHILVYAKWAYPDSLTGTHVNRNSFAAYCGMGLLASLTLLLRHLKNQAMGSTLNIGIALRNMRWREWVLVLALPLQLAALLLTQSRGGLATFGVGVVVLLVGVWRSQIIPRRFSLGLLILCFIGAATAYATLGHGLSARLSADVIEREDRPDIWRITQQMIADYPLQGQGAGAYETAYYHYRDAELGRHFAHAHSAYLEWAAELGLPATALWLLLMAWVGVRLVQGVRQRQQGVLYPLIALAVFVQAATHSLFDFSFQINANAVILTMLLAMGVAQSYSATPKP